MYEQPATTARAATEAMSLQDAIYLAAGLARDAEALSGTARAMADRLAGCDRASGLPAKPAAADAPAPALTMLEELTEALGRIQAQHAETHRMHIRIANGLGFDPTTNARSG